MAFMGSSGYGTPRVQAEETVGGTLIMIRVDGATLGTTIEESERLHMQLGEVLAQLRAKHAEPAEVAA